MVTDKRQRTGLISDDQVLRQQEEKIEKKLYLWAGSGTGECRASSATYFLRTSCNQTHQWM